MKLIEKLQKLLGIECMDLGDVILAYILVIFGLIIFLEFTFLLICIMVTI